MANTVIKHYNDEIIVNSESREKAIEELLNKYEFTVEEYEGNVEEFEGALHTEEYKARVEQARAEQEKQAQIIALKKQLEAIDLRSIRAIRASETERIAQYEAQAQALREQLQALLSEQVPNPGEE